LYWFAISGTGFVISLSLFIIDKRIVKRGWVLSKARAVGVSLICVKRWRFAERGLLSVLAVCYIFGG